MTAETWTAVATVVIALFTIVLALVGGVQSWLTRQTINLARDEFTATHRPRILVEAVRISTKGGSRRNPVSMPDDTVPARAVFTLVNGGESPGRVAEWQATIYIQREDAAFAPTFGRIFTNADPKKWALTPGEFGALEIEQAPVDVAWERFEKAGGHAFIVGRITYEGPDKVRRVTGFCREYSTQSGMWRPVKDSEYEYAH